MAAWYDVHACVWELDILFVVMHLPPSPPIRAVRASSQASRAAGICVAAWADAPPGAWKREEMGTGCRVCRRRAAVGVGCAAPGDLQMGGGGIRNESPLKFLAYAITPS
jgi:hypothetical protein